MKKYAFILSLLFSSILVAQSAITKSIGEFSTVKVYDLINVNMIKSDENRVKISGDNRKDVQIINKNGKLKIRVNLEESYDGNDTVVTLYYTSVDVIDVNEGAKVEVKDELDQYEIKLKAQEGGEITAKVNTTISELRAVTRGIINIDGTTKKQKISVYTGGILNAEELQSETTKVSVNAGGDVSVNASEHVDVKIRAGGDVYIYGNPKEINENRVFGGRVKRM